MIECAYRKGEGSGLAVWTHDQGGPYQTMPYRGHRWCPEGSARRYPSTYVRNGTAKLLTLFHPASGRVRVHGVHHCTNAILHPWLKQEITAILATLPTPHLHGENNRRQWISASTAAADNCRSPAWYKYIPGRLYRPRSAPGTLRAAPASGQKNGKSCH